MPSSRPYLVKIGTRNQQGKGLGDAADGALIGYTEASGLFPVHHDHWRPWRNRRMGLSWDPGAFTPERRGYRHAYWGRPMFTPNTGVAWVAGTMTGGPRVALVVAHLVNNAYGRDVRGRRLLRRRLWRKGMRVARLVVAQLQREGYLVFLVGDFNRHDRGFVPGMVDSAGAAGAVPYDRIFAPARGLAHPLGSLNFSPGPRLSKVTRGRRHGSDHLSYSGLYDLTPAPERGPKHKGPGIVKLLSLPRVSALGTRWL